MNEFKLFSRVAILNGINLLVFSERVDVVEARSAGGEFWTCCNGLIPVLETVPVRASRLFVCWL